MTSCCLGGYGAGVGAGAGYGGGAGGGLGGGAGGLGGGAGGAGRGGYNAYSQDSYAPSMGGGKTTFKVLTRLILPSKPLYFKSS